MGCSEYWLFELSGLLVLWFSWLLLLAWIAIIIAPFFVVDCLLFGRVLSHRRVPGIAMIILIEIVVAAIVPMIAARATISILLVRGHNSRSCRSCSFCFAEAVLWEKGLASHVAFRLQGLEQRVSRSWADRLKVLECFRPYGFEFRASAVRCRLERPFPYFLSPRT